MHLADRRGRSFASDFGRVSRLGDLRVAGRELGVIARGKKLLLVVAVAYLAGVSGLALWAAGRVEERENWLLPAKDLAKPGTAPVRFFSGNALSEGPISSPYATACWTIVSAFVNVLVLAALLGFRARRARRSIDEPH